MLVYLVCGYNTKQIHLWQVGDNMNILFTQNKLQCVLQQAIVSGTLHIATKDGEAMFFHDSINFASFAGSDAGSTPYQFVFYDATGKSAQAFAGAVGGGEAYTDIIGGTDPTLLNGNMEAGNPPSTWAKTGTMTLSAEAERTGGGGAQSLGIIKSVEYSVTYQNVITQGSLYKYQMYAKTANASSYAGAGLENVSTEYTASTSWTLLGPYYRTGGTSAKLVLFPQDATGTYKAFYDDVVLQKLTDVPATGLHLMSAKNGTTRNMKSVESGFNPNTITRVNIYRAYQENL